MYLVKLTVFGINLLISILSYVVHGSFKNKFHNMRTENLSRREKRFTIVLCYTPDDPSERNVLHSDVLHRWLFK